MGIRVDGLEIVHERGEILLPNYHVIGVVVGELIDKAFDRHVGVGLDVMIFQGLAQSLVARLEK